MTLEEAFYACRGNLAQLPEEFKKWKTLQGYRDDWHFLYKYTTYEHVSKISEQCLMCDYYVSLDAWLQPITIFQKRNKIILVQLLASIYEAILSYIINNKIEDQKAADRLFEATFNSEIYGDKRTFGPTLKIATKIGILNPQWSEYLGKINKIRNWIHLTGSEIGPLASFLERETCERLRNKLDEFRLYVATIP